MCIISKYSPTKTSQIVEHPSVKSPIQMQNLFTKCQLGAHLPGIKIPNKVKSPGCEQDLWRNEFYKCKFCNACKDVKIVETHSEEEIHWNLFEENINFVNTLNVYSLSFNVNIN